MTGWLPPLVAVVLALAVGGSARADVCVVVNPVLDIGCRDVQGAPAGGEPTASSEPAGAPREPEPATRSSTVVRYDPNRVAVTFKRGVTRIYFDDETAANAGDPVLASIADPAARRTLIAERVPDGYRFDIRLQGNGETVFFDV